MSSILYPQNGLQIQGFGQFFSSDQFVAIGAAVLLHLIVVTLVLTGWESNPQVEPVVNTIKVRMVMQAKAPEPIIESIPTPPEPSPALETPKPVIKEPLAKQIKEAPFAKKRAEEVTHVESEISAELDTQVSTDIQQKIAAPTELKPVANQTASKEESESTTKSAAKIEPSFDISQYYPVQKDAPTYPQRALDKSVQGLCTVKYNVNALGLVEDPEALGDCHAFFIKPSLEATKSFRYTPRMVDGKAVKVANVKNTFQYRIE